MSENRQRTPASPADIWSVIAQPFQYSDWVVGAKRVRDADDNWPSPGAEIRHTSGFGPIHIDDITKVLEVDEERRIKLEARLGKLGTAEVTIELHDQGDETELVLNEVFIDGPAAKLPPFTEVGLKARNAETLRRLSELAEARAARRS